VPTKVDISDLVSAVEVAERLGLPRSQIVHGWARRYSDLPKPIAELAIGKIWVWPDIENWALAENRPRGYRAYRR